MPELVQRNDVPLVGQPLKVAGFTLSVFFVCLCENPQPLVVSLVNALVAKNGEGRSSATCPACGRHWLVGPNTKVHMDLALNLTPSIATN